MRLSQVVDIATINDCHRRVNLLLNTSYVILRAVLGHYCYSISKLVYVVAKVAWRIIIVSLGPNNPSTGGHSKSTVSSWG